MTSKKFVTPGEKIGAIEEYTPSFGTFSTDDDVFSSNIGKLDIDQKKHVARVTCSTRIPKMQKEGIVALGVVAEVYENVALIDLLPFDSKSFSFVPQGTPAVLHASKIKRGYVDKVSSEIKTGDIVRVKIIEVSRHSVDLTTDGKNLGVVKAYCSRCRYEMQKIGYNLLCPNCGSKESRKTAFDYRSGKIL
jgi:exosome complex component CSL4